MRLFKVPKKKIFTFFFLLKKGMSLDAVEVDVSDTFAQGQTYVALSRCTELEGVPILF